MQPFLSTRFALSDAKETLGNEAVCKDGAEELSCIPSHATKHSSLVPPARRRETRLPAGLDCPLGWIQKVLAGEVTGA